MAQRGQKRRAEETEEQRNRGLSHMAQRGLERKTEETEEQRNSRLSDMAQHSQERRAKEIRRTKEWSIGENFVLQAVYLQLSIVPLSINTEIVIINSPPAIIDT
ncbi:hypothetical protein AVEN_77621-1 [Araneus ventricosus]|uniref:STPR domain-containing protein n=1 Tax=Araneus ventricosus TaxID=182803 RepID=A0A4Y2IH67_ARAVE|nr:hypothetical protein AVEN_77621-1 [Araneus ventricosus]